MDVHTTASAERLAAEFSTLPTSVVVQALTDCVAQFPHSSAWFIEQATRARLQRRVTS